MLPTGGRSAAYRVARFLRVAGRLVAGVLADVLAPPSCAACGAALGRQAVFCGICAASILASPDARAVGIYGGALAIAVRRLKYSDRPDLARPLGELLRRRVVELGSRADLVIPVPLHPKRLAQRGYNQAALLASRLTDDVGGRLEIGALVRMRDTPQQARLPPARRHANVAGAFRVRAPERIWGRRVLLVDDVLTSGATVGECARALRASGADRVEVLVLARAASARSP